MFFSLLLLQSELVYCLAVVKSAELSIIGRKSLILSGYDMLMIECAI